MKSLMVVILGIAVAMCAATGLEAGWVETAQLIDAAGSAGEHLGADVAIDGDVAVVGALLNSALVFVRSKGVWTQAATLVPSTSGGGDLFGASVAISGDVVAIGTVNNLGHNGAVDVYTRPPGGWAGTLTENARLTSGSDDYNFLGASVSFAGGDIASGATLAGKVYVFEPPVSGWSGSVTPASVLVASDGAAGDLFGWATGGSGNVIVTTAPSAVVDGISGAGKAYVYVRPTAGWSGTQTESARLLPTDPASNGQFGESAGIDGTTAVVASRDGNGSDLPLHEKGYVFVQPLFGWAGDLNETAQLVASDVTSNITDFGAAASISGDRIVIGDPTGGGGDGAAYVFERPVGGWAGTVSEEFEFDGFAFNEIFGASVAVSGSTIVIGSPLETVESNAEQGEAHVFDLVKPVVTRTRFLVQGPIRVAPGVPVEFRFEVEALLGGAAVPKGEVIVSDDAGQTCRSDVSSPGSVPGEGSCSLTFGNPGTYPVHAQYLGNLAFAPSTSPAEPVLVRGAAGAP